MQIDEAIKILDPNPKVPYIFNEREWHEALQLGIEALKRIKEHRSKGYLRAHELLPGETKE